MCGIAALAASSLTSEQAEQRIAVSLATIAHRGDQRHQGERWARASFAGGANRLPFTSGDEQQPATDSSGRFRVFLNGEIYSLHGARDATGQPVSDTRAFAEACALQGPIEAIVRNHGMFALVIHDAQEQAVYLARDRFGIKPLYFAKTGRGVFIASELKALTCHDEVDRIDHVNPGSVLRISRNGSIAEVHRLILKPSAETYDDLAFASALRDALAQSVAEQVRDRHRYAVYLSGGIDSSSVYALARQAGAEMVPLVLGTAKASDVAAAAAVAAYFGDTLEVVTCPPEEILFEDIAETVRICESFEPNVVRQSAVSRVLARGAASRGCRVALCGEGADELLGGYPEFWHARRSFSTIRAAFLQDLPRTQLQRVDRVNMASTIEVRVPFLTDRVAALALSKGSHRDFAASRSGLMAKLPLRRAMAGMLPEAILQREKVVLSEGAGLRGNSSSGGMFSDVFAAMDNVPEFDAETRKLWGLSTREECYYFSIFESLGYAAYRGARKRVFANATATKLVETAGAVHSWVPHSM
jgi:asparagine synthase (glutamine-hydrolysing)